MRSGIAGSVTKEIWTKACVFPSTCAEFLITEEERELLRMFGGKDT